MGQKSNIKNNKFMKYLKIYIFLFIFNFSSLHAEIVNKIIIDLISNLT